jgi:hypothetical protein
MKRCERCKEVKPPEDYESATDPVCLPCKKIIMKKAEQGVVEKYGSVLESLADMDTEARVQED